MTDHRTGARPFSRVAGASRLTVLLVALLVVLTASAGVVWWTVVHPGPSRATQGSATATAAATAVPEPDDRLPRSAVPLDDQQIVWRYGTGSARTMTTISSDGALGTVVLATGEQDIAPSLSHDRRTVLFIRREEPGNRNSLHAVAADGSSERFLFRDGTTSCPYLREARANVDGTLGLACGKDSSSSSSYALLTARLDGTILHTLDRGLIGSFTFSPDGRTVLYPKASAGTWARGGALYAVATDGSGEPRKVLTGRNTAPAWAPAGDVVAFSRLEDDDRSQIELLKLGRTATVLAVLTSGPQIKTDSSWSPDGEFLAFRRIADKDHLTLATITRGGAEERNLFDAGWVGAPSWTGK